MFGEGSRRVLVLFLVSAVLGGCAGSDEGPEYSGVQELAVALEDIGFECRGEVEVVSFAEVIAGVSGDFAECMVSPPAGDLELAVFDSPDELDRALDGVLRDTPDPFVIGKNWFVTAEKEEWATRIVDDLGGRLVEPESPNAPEFYIEERSPGP